MSSTNKTSSLQLNQWLGSDKPTREDFNRDNVYIDNAMATHFADTVSHVSQQDRSRWDNDLYLGVYFGTGELSRTVTTDCPFEAKMVIVFCLNRPAAVNNYSAGKNFNYFAIGSIVGDMLGIGLNDDCKSFVVAQTPMEIYKDEFVNLNEIGETYAYIMIK